MQVEDASPETTAALLARVKARALPGGADVGPTIHLRQRGHLRLEPEGPWRPFGARQTIEGGTTAFRWRAWVRMAPGLSARVVDAFADGHGRLDAHLLGLVRVARGRGKGIDQAEVQRYLAELPWCPPALVHNPDLVFAARGKDQLRVTYSPLGPDASVDLDVAADGTVERVHALRPRETPGGAVATPWEGRFEDWRECAGLSYPARAEVAWNLPEGRFVCFRGEITRFEARHG